MHMRSGKFVSVVWQKNEKFFNKAYEQILSGGDNCDIIVTVLEEMSLRDLLFQGWKSFMKLIASIPLVL